MAILGKNNLIADDLEPQDEEYIIPAVIRNNEEGLPLKKSIFLSAVLHPAAAGAVWLFIFILALMGITFSIFERPKSKMHDIEFVLVDNAKEQMPLDKKTPFRSDRNTRTGGKRDPSRKVSMPSPTPAKSSVQQKSTPGPKANIPKTVQKQTVQPKAAQEAKPAAPSARPSLKPSSIPKPAIKPLSPFAVPVPKGGTAKGTPSTGPVGGHGSASTGKSGSKGQSYAPVPSLAPASGAGGSAGSKLSRGASGYGNPGNPGGGGGAPGIDSIREPDFGPYMRELQRRIKLNWEPPKGNESKRVVLLFKIAKDGRLLSVKVFKSSGLPNADKAALNAVELTAPFRPLPADYRGNNIDIQFTFDYNVFGATGY